MIASLLQRAAAYVSFLGGMDQDVALLPAPHIGQFDVRKMQWWHGAHGRENIIASSLQRAAVYVSFLGRMHQCEALAPTLQFVRFDVRKMQWWRGSHGPRKYASVVAAACC